MGGMNVRSAGIFLLCVFLFASSAAYAQMSLSPVRTLILAVTPENPAPGETVRLSVTSSAIDLDRSVITWRANGTAFAGGPGVKEAAIVAGAAGSVTEITVEALNEAGDAGRAEARIAPSELDLLWTTDSYAPPFFKGRKLAGTGANVSAYAFARFGDGTVRVPERDIIYTWYRNGSVVAKASGRGKSRALIDGPARGTVTIAVVAETADRSWRSEASAQVTAYDSRLVLYENHPLFGVLYHRAIVGDVNTIERELKLDAVPYFARTKDPGWLSYEWTLNGIRIQPNEAAPATLTVAAEDYNGPADIELVAMNPADIIMRSIGSWRIIFGGSGGIFGGSLFGQ